MWGYEYGHPMMGYGFSIIGALFSILWIAILVMSSVVLIRWLRGSRGTPMMGCWHDHSGNTALNILKERYARGEIDKAEFEDKKKDLT